MSSLFKKPVASFEDLPSPSLITHHIEIDGTTEIPDILDDPDISDVYSNDPAKRMELIRCENIHEKDNCYVHKGCINCKV